MLIARERIGLFRIGVGSQATTDEPFWDTFGQRPGQSGDFVVPRGRHRMKPRIAVVIRRVHAIDGQHVQVYVQIQSRTESLYEGHGTALRIRFGAQWDGPAN